MSKSQKKYIEEEKVSEEKVSEKKGKGYNYKDLEDLALIMWDGLGFFKFDLKKVPRMRRVAIKWSDKFTDPFDTPILILTAVLFVLVIYPEAHNFIMGIEKTQEI